MMDVQSFSPRKPLQRRNMSFSLICGRRGGWEKREGEGRGRREGGKIVNAPGAPKF
jgi:hypothetical protein